MIQGRMTNI